MTNVPAQGPVVQVDPQPNIYTLMLIIAIIALIVTIGITLHNLMSPVVKADGSAGGYGMGLADLFGSLETLIPGN